jgi:hypothetical protein
MGPKAFQILHHDQVQGNPRCMSHFTG